MSAIIEAELVSSPMLVPRAQDLPPLTHKQTKFVNAYLETRNGTESARKAGYDTDENTLRAIASENLTKPSIQAHLQHALKQRQISPDEVLAELSDIAIAPWKDFLQVKYGPNSDIVVDVQLKLSEKLKALELAGKYHKLWDKQEIDPDQTRVLADFTELCRTLMERVRSQQQIPASVGEQTP